MGFDPSCGLLQRTSFLLNVQAIGHHHSYDQKKNIGHKVRKDITGSLIKFNYLPMQKNVDQSKLVQILDLNSLILVC